MSCKKLKMICFSPTRTTHRILDAIAEGVGAQQLEVLDMTRTDNVPESCDCADDLVIIGGPVYSGRIPLTAVERFKVLKSCGSPVVPVVVYGNRAYEDALVELSDIVTEAGFKTVAGAAFIGEHSFSTEKTPIAVSRPDEDDLGKAREFGKSLAAKLADGTLAAASVEVPGNRPYKDRSPKASASPISNDGCQLCGSCERVCPTAAISVGSLVETDPDKCIFCCACVKVCAFEARKLEVPKLLEVSQWLADNFSARREPEIFI
ncbi:4Fe-4S binding protein [Desulfovibrio sp. JC022]|uniref:4Fe-4S binding protein n=1 Tax=Desulfovibrio sp. JC022 TaxID=2593642 RepID=UPI0013D4FE6C|nr:4Fe-4S binding protein [Desulfovibrio sp. JC022]NDV22968.1 4Fe-4S ferredoxin [Desulfovibrio sp. JC022]